MEAMVEVFGVWKSHATRSGDFEKNFLSLKKYLNCHNFSNTVENRWKNTTAAEKNIRLPMEKNGNVIKFPHRKQPRVPNMPLTYAQQF